MAIFDDKITLHDDIMQPFMIDKSGINGRIIRMGRTVDTIISRHNYPDSVNVILAEFLALGAALATALKFDGIFTLQIKGDGPIPMMVCDITSNGDIRGYVQIKGKLPPDEDIKIAPAAAFFNKGYIAFTVDQVADMERYQGIVELKGKNLEECIKHYFAQSDQFSSEIKLAAGKDINGKWRAAAIILQRLPEEGGINVAKETSDDWNRAKILMHSVKPQELLAPDLTSEDILFRLFNEDGIRVFDKKSFDIGCRCSREKISNVIRQLSADDVNHSMIEDVIKVNCEFCNQEFIFNHDDIQALQ